MTNTKALAPELDSAETLRAIAAGREIVERAENLKVHGVIKDYTVFVLERDPRIIDHVTLIKHSETSDG